MQRPMMGSILFVTFGLAGCVTNPERGQPSPPLEVELESSPPPAPEDARRLEMKGLVSLPIQRTALAKQPLDRTEQFDWTATGWLEPKLDEEMRVHFLPIGAGSCQIVECPGPGAIPMIVDCGKGHRETRAPMAVEDVQAYVSSVLVGREAKVVVSHADFDHYRYIPSIINAESVHSLWLGGYHADYPENFMEFANDVRDHGTVENPRVVEEFEVNWHNDGFAVDDLACGTASSFVLAVNNGDEKNDHSLILSIDHGDFRVVFPGDAVGASEQAAIENFPGNLLVSTVVASSHHGSNTPKGNPSNSEAWVAATQPLFVIYSAGSLYGHPRCEVAERFREGGSLLPAAPHSFACTGGLSSGVSTLAEYNTQQSGVIVITSDAALDNLRLECHPGPC